MFFVVLVIGSLFGFELLILIMFYCFVELFDLFCKMMDFWNNDYDFDSVCVNMLIVFCLNEMNFKLVVCNWFGKVV